MNTKAKPFWDPEYLGKSVVYIIWNIKNWKRYVGKSSSLTRGYRGGGKYLKNSMRKHGERSFISEIVEEVKDLTTLNEREVFYIDYYNSRAPKGYNISVGGDGVGCGKDHVKFRNLVGQKFGRLTVMKLEEPRRKVTRWHCRCECGEETLVSSSSLRSGTTVSCGCFWLDRMREVHTKHGQGSRGRSRPRGYSAWVTVKMREKERGFKFPKKWEEYLGFIDDVGEPPGKWSVLCKREKSKGHSKRNSYWGTQKDSKSHLEHKFLYGGKWHTYASLAKKAGVDPSSMWHRINRHGVENCMNGLRESIETHQGRSVQEWADSKGVSYSTLWEIVRRRGWKYVESYTPKNRWRDYLGKRVSQWAAQKGITTTQVYSWVKRRGWEFVASLPDRGEPHYGDPWKWSRLHPEVVRDPP